MYIVVYILKRIDNGGCEMGKSISFGGFRINLSKSGIGVSFGAKGFRIGMGPRGNYVRIGRNSIYYDGKGRDNSQNKGRGGSQEEPLPEIESKEARMITDELSAEIVEELNRKVKKVSFFPVCIGITTLCAAIPHTRFLLLPALLLDIAVFILDRVRKTCVITYDIDYQMKQRIQAFYNSFDELMKSCRKWHVEAQGNPGGKKSVGGADMLVTRKEIKIKYGTPRFVKTNIRTPVIPVGKQTLYFFPDRVLIYEGKSVAALSYSSLELDCGRERFAEKGRVPPDSRTDGYVWKYANKTGEPDRRYKNNSKVPIVIYSYIHFKSSTGLNERVQLSASDLEFNIRRTLKELSSEASCHDAGSVVKTDM